MRKEKLIGIGVTTFMILGILYLVFVFPSHLNKCCMCGNSENKCCPCPNQEMKELIDKEYNNPRIGGAGMFLEYCNSYNNKYNTSINCFE